MESIFTNNEIGNLANAISKYGTLSLRVNKCGNLDVKDTRANGNTLHFVFYKRDKRDYFVRRRVGSGGGLNQRGSVMNNGNHFSSMTNLINYFVNYADKNDKGLYFTTSV